MALALAAWLVDVDPARAQLAGRYVIEAGREAEVLALFAPHALGGEVVPGWRLGDVRIEQDRILGVVVGPGGERATLRLEHVDAARGALRTASFAMTLASGGPRGQPALRALAEAVRRNDDGRFWRVREDAAAPPEQLRASATDGIVIALVGLSLLLAVIVVQLRGAPRWVGPSLLAVVVLAGVLRVTLSPVAALGVWPYTRVLGLASLMFHGPVLAWIGEALSARIYYTELVFTLNLIVATLTPIAAYAHAHYVLRDPRAALACAGLFAIFPNHLRFSHSEVEFVLSLALSSYVLALLHAALVERSRVLQVASSLALPLALHAAILTRELNILLVPLGAGAALMLRGSAPRARLAVVLVGIALGAATGVSHLLAVYPTQVREGLSLETVANAVGALFSVRHDTLINPRVTPLGITALAVAGAVWMWRAGDRRHVAFLIGWLGFYFVAHSYVLPNELAMQARYHLHLAPPLLLLAAPAVVALWERHRVAGSVALAYLAAVPLLHLDFIRDTAFNDAREYAFVRSSRELVPEGCTVLEYQGYADHDVRFTRMGTVLDSGERRIRWSAIPAAAIEGTGGDPLRPEVRALLDDPPECLVYYESLNCWAVKEVDEPIAPACAALRELAPLEELARTRFESRPYDENLARGLGPDVQEITLTLYRVRPRPR